MATGALATSVVGGITIWKYFRKDYHLAAYVLSTKSPLPYETENLVDEFIKFTVDEFEKTPKPKTLSRDELSKITGHFKRTIDSRAYSTMILPLAGREHLTVLTIRNEGDQTLSSVQIKTRLSVEATALVEKDDGTKETKNFKGRLELGELSPRSEVVIYAYSFTPFLFDEYSTVLSHNKGLGETYFYRPVPRLVTQTSGIYISYFGSTVILASILFLTLMTWIIFRLWKRRQG